MNLPTEGRKSDIMVHLKCCVSLACAAQAVDRWELTKLWAESMGPTLCYVHTSPDAKWNANGPGLPARATPQLHRTDPRRDRAGGGAKTTSFLLRRRWKDRIRFGSREGQGAERRWNERPSGMKKKL